MTRDDQRFMLYTALIATGKCTDDSVQSGRIYALAGTLLRDYEEQERIVRDAARGWAPVTKPPLGEIRRLPTAMDYARRLGKEAEAYLIVQQKDDVFTALMVSLDCVAANWASGEPGALKTDAAYWWRRLRLETTREWAQWYIDQRIADAEGNDVPEPPGSEGA